MRSRLIVGMIIAAVPSMLSSTVAAGQPVPSDDEAWGELIPDGADVGALDGGFQPGGPDTTARRSPDIYCKLMLPGTEGTGDGDSEATLQRELNNALARGDDHILVYRVCFDRATGQAVRIPGQQDAGRPIPWPPDSGGLIEPELLADIARSRLSFPSPSGGMTPSLETGTVAQLATYFFIDNWGPVDASATAGSVTAVVTATPMSQTWTISDALRGDYSVSCNGPGVPVEVSSLTDAPPPGACSWTPPHSSAGQPTNHGPTGGECFAATVTITWDVGWDSNITAPADLGEGTSAASTCLFVDEIQALVTND